MGEHWFHYTSRQFAQEIRISRKLKPPPRGKLYLTQDFYERGADAANHLAIINKPVEMACLITKDMLPEDPTPVKPRHVEPILGPDGEEIRAGCGLEQFIMEEVKDQDFEWISLMMP